MLYVEDEGTIGLLFELIMRSRHPATQICVVSTSERALAYLRQQTPYEGATRPNLVILDVNLGFESGLDLLEIVRNDPELASLPVLIFSSSQLPNDRARAKALHALDFIRKPVELDDFERCIDNIHSHAA